MSRSLVRIQQGVQNNKETYSKFFHLNFMCKVKKKMFPFFILKIVMTKLTFYDSNNTMRVTPLDNDKIKFEIGSEHFELCTDDVDLLTKVLIHYHTKNSYPKIAIN